ncbi:MAG: ferric reductase-like transmembrane domain-containing protein [Planctomycetia bacterium]|nr:ferric reductase-like transmembrane domain-containing protein [Planctomycetia bacterium]
MTVSQEATITQTENEPPASTAFSVTQPRAILLVMLYIAVLVVPLALASLSGRVPAGQFIKQLALGFGLTGLMIIAASFILAARYQWIAKPFGLDAVMLFHRRMAIAGFGALILHVILMVSLNIRLLTHLSLPWKLQLGRIAFLLLATQIGVSIYRSRLRVEFEKWRFSHRLLGLAVLVFAFTHGLLSSEAFAPWPLRIFVLAVMAAALVSIVWTRMVRPPRLRQYRYAVHDVRQINRAVWQVQLKPRPGGQALQYSPGQFAFFHFHRSPPFAPGEEHVWTIASSPSETDGIMLAIKELGDFTRTIGRTVQPGDAVTVHGPFGRFSHRFHADTGELVFIAAGIGITPFRSMIRWITDGAEDRRVLLLYANRCADEIPFLEELTQCQNRSGGKIRIVHVLSRPDPNWNGEKGHIDVALIQKYCAGNLSGKTFWICGPGAFTTSLIDSLCTAGVAAQNIHNEAFCLVHAPVQSDGRGRKLKSLCNAICITGLLMVLLFAVVRTDFLSAHGNNKRHAAHTAVNHAHSHPWPDRPD